jgi:hypothetical protein
MAYIALSDIAEATSNTADDLGRKAHSGYEVEWNTEPDFVDTGEVEDLTGWFLPEEPELIAVDEPEEGITHWGHGEAEVEKG